MSWWPTETRNRSRAGEFKAVPTLNARDLPDINLDFRTPAPWITLGVMEKDHGGSVHGKLAGWRSQMGAKSCVRSRYI